MPNAPQILPQNDKALIKAVRKGRVWSAVDELPTPEQLADPTFVATMPTIQATTIRALCLGLWDDVIAAPKGVRVVGARIVGKLDLSFGAARCQLALVLCHFTEELVVQSAYLPALNLSGSHLSKGLEGDGVHIASDLFCVKGFTSKGTVRLLGAQIGGDVDFVGATLDGDGGTALNADRMVVKGSLFCRDGFTSKGEVRLSIAQIDGTAEFEGAQLDGGVTGATLQDGTGAPLKDGRIVTLQNGTEVTLDDGTFATLNHGPVATRKHGTIVPLKQGTTVKLQDGTIATLSDKPVAALIADGITVKRGLFCRNHFTSKGEVRLPAAQIGNIVDFSNATLDGGRGDALSAAGIVVKGGLFCRNGFRSTGDIVLLGAHIGGSAEFDGAQLDGGKGNALSADRMVVAGSLFCREGFTSKGTVRLLSAQIGSDADFSNATLDGRKGDALIANGIIVTGNLLCSIDFQSTGDVKLIAAKIGGLLGWRPTKGTGQLNLSHATAGQWADDWDSEKKKAGEKKETPTLNLNHFIYGAFADGDTKTDSDTRIAWIKASQGDKFKPGPYRTLARVLRAAGDDRGAKNVGFAMEKAWTKHQAKSYKLIKRMFYCAGRFILEWTIGYGYRSGRGFIGLCILLGAGTVLFSWGSPSNYNCPPLTCWLSTSGTGIIKPADPVFITENQTRNLLYAPPSKHDFLYSLPPEYTPFNAFWYSFDTLIPLIDLGQEKAWSPSPLTTKISDDIPGWALLFYLYFHIIMGWVLSTLTVVALTGLIKRDPEGEE